MLRSSQSNSAALTCIEPDKHFGEL